MSVANCTVERAAKMKKRETDAERQSRIDRYLTGRWSMTESAVILEKPMRTLTSYVTGQSLSCAPRVWTAEEFNLEAQSPASDKLRKRARYGFPNLLQFVAAPKLFAEGVERPLVQRIMDSIAAPGDKSLKMGYYLILTGGETQTGYFFPTREAMLEAITSNLIPLPQCAIFNFTELHNEVIERIAAWEDRRSYIPKSKENLQDVARSEWIAAGAKRIPGSLGEAISKAQREGQKKH
jgi:hypothetical protein